jgi:hypothetical protein
MMDQLFKNKLDWGVQVSRGNILNATVTHRYGLANVGTSFVPITDNLVYRTPQAGAATALRIKAGGNAADTAAGAGARSLRLTGMNADGDMVSETLATAGASASAATSATFIRLFNAEVVDSGTYGTQSAGSHVGDIVIENAAGGTDWATIPVNGFPVSNTSIGSYTIPRTYTGFIEGISIAVEGAKLVDILMLSRSGVLQTAAPYKPVKRVAEWIGVANTLVDTFTMPLAFEELTDVGLLGKVSNGTGNVTIQMDILLLKNE